VDDAEHMPFYVLFGVIVAAMLAGLFIVQYNRQLEARVDEQAQALVNDLARISFTAFSREQPSFLLPQTLGGSNYELSVDENTFIVHIKVGKQSGMSYYATANVPLIENNFNPVPGNSVYFKQSGDVVIISSSPITVQPENLWPPITATPPEFYYFAKENAKAATAIASAYFEARNRYSEENIDVSAYWWENENNLRAQITSNGENLTVFWVTGSENNTVVGKVENAWIVDLVDNVAEILVDATPCYSPDNAYRSGWLYSPAEALAYLRSRTWMSGDTPVVVPENASVRAAAATTNVSIYPTYCVTFDGYVIYYRAMPWWAQENSPGFVFQSEPELEAVA